MGRLQTDLHSMLVMLRGGFVAASFSTGRGVNPVNLGSRDVISISRSSIVPSPSTTSDAILYFTLDTQPLLGQGITIITVTDYDIHNINDMRKNSGSLDDNSCNVVLVFTIIKNSNRTTYLQHVITHKNPKVINVLLYNFLIYKI